MNTRKWILTITWCSFWIAAALLTWFLAQSGAA